MRMRWLVRECTCDECLECKMCIVIEPHGCFEYGTCNDGIEICPECLKKKTNELIDKKE